MVEPAQPARRARRRRRPEGASPTAGPVAGAADAEPTRPAPRRARAETGDRGLRDIVGSGPSRLGVSRALRGRDVDRPTAEDLAAAERDVVIVRRDWKPDTS